MPCLLRMFWPYRFTERPPYVRTPLFFCPIFDFDLPLTLSCSGRCYLCEELDEEGLSF